MNKHLVISMFMVGLVLTGAGCGLKTTTTDANNAKTKSAEVNTAQTQAVTMTDDSLVGVWLSKCLVPDEGSAWSEQHQFVINSEGTAVYTRWSAYDHNCTKTNTIIRNYTYTLPAAERINLTDTEAGATIYDMYLVSGQTLKFGHGFQARYPAGYDATQGNTAANPFHVLNDYIVYTKQ